MTVDKITNAPTPNEQIDKINEIIDNLSSSSITVDSALSTTSTNPVQNKVVTAALNGKQSTISDLSTIRTGASAGATAVQPGDLANVATSGSYNDLSNKPTIPTVPLEGVQINGTDLTITNKKVNIPLSGTDTLGVAKANAAYGVYNNNGNLTISKATDTQVTQKTSLYRPLTPSNIDLAVKLGVTTNGIPLTDAEKVHAKDWLGISESGGITDVIVNDTSVVSGGVANIKTNGTYNASSNKIATMSDVFSRNIGEIVQSTIPLTDAGLHLLDGSLLAYGSYKAFIDYIASIYSASSNYFCTENEWQTSVATYGVCGKFVYNSTNNTVRLPKITGFIEGIDSSSTLGNLTEAGLPNITGNLTSVYGGGYDEANGAFATDGSAGTGGGSSGSNPKKINLDASRSSSIYGNSTTVQPQAIKVLYYIVIANSTKTEIEVDIDEIATDLNGKADKDLSNLVSTSSTNFDGSPTFKYALLVEGKVTVDTSVNLKSTGYLPNDNYRYEVFVSNLLRSTSQIHSSIGNVASPATNTTAGIICECRTASSSTYSYNQCWIPLDTNGVIYYQTSGSPSTGITFGLLGYRRIGTNT